MECSILEQNCGKETGSVAQPWHFLREWLGCVNGHRQLCNQRNW